MYMSPNHPDYGKAKAAPAAASPPEPSGRLLLAIERPARGKDPAGEVRVSLDSWQGHDYLSIRLWTRGNDGFWPSKTKGITVRLSECEDMAAALLEGLRLSHVVPARLPSAGQGQRRQDGGQARGINQSHLGAPRRQDEDLPLMRSQESTASTYSSECDELY